MKEVLRPVTRMTTGRGPDDPGFVADWEDLLRAVGERLRPGVGAAGSAP